MRKSPFALLLAGLIALSGCYHVRVESGRPSNGTVIDQPFAMSFIYGLVPPAAVDAAAECPGGLAVVETEMSFVNGLVATITAGIVTPMHIHVECAGAGSASLPTDAPEVAVTDLDKPAAIQDAIKDAADLAVASGEPVLVRFE